AERDDVLVECAAMMAQDVAGVEGIGADRRAAIPASGPKVMQSLQVAALALPVADRVIDEFEVAHAAEVRDREYRVEHRLQTDILALVRQQVHLQETLVRLLLNLDEVRNRDRSLDLREINSLGGGAAILNIHSYTPDGRRAKAKKLRLTAQN